MNGSVVKKDDNGAIEIEEQQGEGRRKDIKGCNCVKTKKKYIIALKKKTRASIDKNSEVSNFSKTNFYLDLLKCILKNLSLYGHR